MKSLSDLVGRLMLLLYGVIAYIATLAVTAYTVAFFGNAWVPKTIDSVATAPLLQSLLINLGLVLLFGLQHSVMARPWFKRLLVRVIPEAAERSTYVLISSIALALLMFFWQPLGGVVWDIRDSVAVALIGALYYSGWVLMFWATFMICHGELFGIRQAWFAFRNRPYEACKFKTPAAYRVIRHPDLHELDHRLVGLADDDAGAPRHCGRIDGLRNHRHWLRRARPDQAPSRLRAVSPQGSGIAAVV